MIKRILRCTVLLLALMCLIAGCAQTSPITKISQANDVPNLLARHPVVSLNMSYLNMTVYDDITYSMTAMMQDGAISIIDSSQKDMLFYYADQRMHILDKDKDFYTIVMSDFMYANHTLSFLEQKDYYDSAHYKLVSQTKDKQDKTKVLVYSFEINDVLLEEVSLWGLSKGETIIMTYVVDENWVILSQTMELDVKGKSNVLLLTKDFSYKDEFVQDATLRSYIQPEETVTVTIFNTMNTDAKPMKYNIPKDTYFGYDYSDIAMDLFYDASCTKLFWHSDDTIEKDITLYLAKANISDQ